jgi:Ca2+-binding RTX toxin-like protein
MTRRMLVSALAASFTLLAPAAAQAGSHITWTPERLTVTTDGAGDVVSLYTREYVSNGETVVFPAFTTGGPTTWEPNANCISDAGYIVCDQAASFLFQGGGGNDTLSISDDSALNGVPATLNGAGGNDKLQDFSPAPRTLDGGEGNDVMFGSGGDDIMRGGNGNDEVDGEGGNDNVSGGDGDDKLFGDHFKAPGSDVIDGGPGFDRVIDDYPVGEGPVTVTLDNLANDGRVGENDNLIGIEQIEGPPGTYVGSDAAETFTVGATGQTSSVSGGGGNDTITTLNGSDRVDGGAGDDRLVTGFDNDNVTGGPGRDTIFSDATGNYCGIFTCTVPFGNDTVNARDGEADTIDCGVGADRAVLDAIDTHANCETADVSDGGAAALTVLSKRSIRQIARRGLRIRVICPARCTIGARLTTNKALARGLRLGRSRQLAAARKTLRSAGTATLTLKVARKARRPFSRLRRATVTLTVRRSGTTTLSRRLRLSR